LDSPLLPRQPGRRPKAFATPAWSQTEGLVMEEVMVTATKRETTLMETGISISAYSSEKLQEFGIDDLDDLSVNTPGLSITGGERITIRGLGIDSCVGN
jgi:iron complex outermembrane receptor protein